MLDILHVTRIRNQVFGWNDNHIVYTYQCNTLVTAKIIKDKLEKYINYKGTIPERYYKFINETYNR